MIENHSEQEDAMRARAEQQKQMGRDLAAAYARLFSTEDGKRVLADLRKKFGVHRLVFKPDARGRFDYLDAALRDGERHVMSEIEGALLTATPIPPQV